VKRQSVFVQLFLTLLFLLGLTIAATGVFGIRSLRTYAEADALLRQGELARTLIALYDEAGADSRDGAVERFLNRLPEDPGFRLTVVDPDGRVLGDTHENAAVMNNHANRPEIRQALVDGRGSSIRSSATLGGEPLIYTAFFDADRKLVFRVARTVEGLQEGLARSISALMLFAVILIAVSAVLSALAARRVSRLLNQVREVAGHFARGDFSRPLSLSGFLEADELSRSINRMGRQLRSTIEAIELRQDELQSMLEGMTAPVVLLDERLDIREINPAALKLAGSRLEDSRGRSLLQVFRSPELYDLARSLVSGGEQTESLIRLEGETGTVYLQTNASLVQAGCLLVMNDITRITQLEMMRKDFVANVSHELRTPITSILGFVETLRQAENLDRSRQKDFLGIIHRQSLRLGNIIDDLMALSRLEEGEEPPSLESVDVDQLFQGAVDTLAFKSDERRIRIVRRVPPNLMCPVYPILAEQALVNLLDNAVKYGPEGSEVRLIASDAGNEVVMEVQDDGPGLPESELNRVFERFHRVDKARSRDLGGTGLGLAIVKHIALKHGGRAWVESRLGDGCAFKIAFPSVP